MYYYVIIGELHFFCKISVHNFFSLLGLGFFSFIDLYGLSAVIMAINPLSIINAGNIFF